MIPTETERKYLIRMPDDETLLAIEGCEKSRIVQTYLKSEQNEPHVSERIRKREYADKTIYTHTTKKRISSMSAIEDEEQISRESYKLLKLRRDPDKRRIRKFRYAIPWRDHVVEIDVYPFWEKQAVMEIELKSETEQVDLPPFAEVIREVTGDRAYSNNSLSKKIPDED